MGEEQGSFEEVHKRIWDELVHLHHTWAQYQALYGSSSERVRLLNQSARSFFAGLQRMMVRDVLLCISRLTDPPKDRKRDNLVLLRVLEDPKLQSHAQLEAYLATEIADITVQADPIRRHRNRYIAHLDHATAMGSRDDPLPPVTGEIVSGVISRMGETYHRYCSELYDSDVAFDLAALGDVESLVKALENAEKWRQHEVVEMKRRYGMLPDGNSAT